MFGSRGLPLTPAKHYPLFLYKIVLCGRGLPWEAQGIMNLMFQEGRIIFFDFDGVIADTFAACFTVSKMIHPRLTPEEYRKRFYGNVNETAVGEWFREEYHPEIDFFTELKPRLLKCELFPGMREVIEYFSRRRPLIIISSTHSDLIREFLHVNALDHCFGSILGNEVHASKVRKMEMAFAQYGALPDECCFVTDTLGDIKEAHRLGVRAIGVTWGFQAKEILERGAPSVIVDVPYELRAALQ